MNEVHALMTLAMIHFVALMSPGPDLALVIQHVTRFGRQTGFYIALGLSCSILTHAVLSVTGVSYLVQQQPLIFSMLQLAGGVYLLYLGSGALITTLRRWHRATDAVVAGDAPVLLNKRHAFSRGFVTNLLNPKALVFFVTLVSALIPAQMSVFGKGAALLIIWSLSITWFGFLAWMLARPSLQHRLHKAERYIDLLCGSAFTVLGVFMLYQIVR